MTQKEQNDLENSLKQREDELKNHEKQLQDIYRDIEAQKAGLTQREHSVTIAEQKRDAGFADERSALNNELRDKRSQIEMEITEYREGKLSTVEAELAEIKVKRLQDVEKSENVERDRIRAEIAKEREIWTKQLDENKKQLNNERMEFDKQKGALSALQSELEGRKYELESTERMLARKEQQLEQQWERRSRQLDEGVEARLEEGQKSLESQRQTIANENIRLREALKSQDTLLGTFEQLKRQLGGKDAAEVVKELNEYLDEIKRLKEELATRPTEETRERLKSYEVEAANQKNRADRLEQQMTDNEAAIAEVNELRRGNSELSAERRSLMQQVKLMEGLKDKAEQELERLLAAYERPAEVGKRHKEIEKPHVDAGKAEKPVKHGIDEMTWLKGIGNACDNYGLHFNPRILKAFHTSLKTAEWSPLTILAGVSGTGKSELPRLYSHFGGIYFEPLSVQPNWDSQESMLGFFNSIDNRFDAQPVLRFLAQSQKPWSDDYPGLQDAVCLILLDEMNLAHPELYFAEFLSKFELRRGRSGRDLPSIPVKIGSGMDPYELLLGRNVLWTGTMNQDETTKSLSDKVLDRSIIINFPRPTELKRRLKLEALGNNNRGPILHKGDWQSWLAQGSNFSEEQVKPFIDFIQDVNSALSVTGRALGHRVWQSIEYYMANYPDVRAAQKNGGTKEIEAAMHIAFEDQLVQKVMPKLRGIDTRGKSKTDCLDVIQSQIISGVNGSGFNLIEDFNLACELGYGQFIWQSANYLKDE